MSQIQVDTILDKAGTGAPQLDYGAEVLVGQGITGAGGINISGVATASSFSGNLTGNPTLGTGVTVYATGIVSATSYYGDGSTLTNAGITAGKAMGLAAFLL